MCLYLSPKLNKRREDITFPSLNFFFYSKGLSNSNIRNNCNTLNDFNEVRNRIVFTMVLVGAEEPSSRH